MSLLKGEKTFGKMVSGSKYILKLSKDEGLTEALPHMKEVQKAIFDGKKLFVKAMRDKEEKRLAILDGNVEGDPGLSGALVVAGAPGAPGGDPSGPPGGDPSALDDGQQPKMTFHRFRKFHPERKKTIKTVTTTTTYEGPMEEEVLKIRAEGSAATSRNVLNMLKHGVAA